MRLYKYFGQILNFHKIKTEQTYNFKGCAKKDKSYRLSEYAIPVPKWLPGHGSFLIEKRTEKPRKKNYNFFFNLELFLCQYSSLDASADQIFIAGHGCLIYKTWEMAPNCGGDRCTMCWFIFWWRILIHSQIWPPRVVNFLSFWVCEVRGNISHNKNDKYSV